MSESYKELLAQIEKLKLEAEAARVAERDAAIAEIRKLMADKGVTVDDLRGAGVRRSRQAVAPVMDKYKHPATGETWSGRGRAPRWLVTEEARGKSRDEFLIAR